MSVGSDNWADAPPVAWQSYQDATHTLTYGIEAFEAAEAADWGYHRSAWWKFVVPDDYLFTGENYVRLDTSRSSYEPGGFADPYLLVYQGDSPEALTPVLDGALIEFAPTAGEVYWIKFIQWIGDDTDIEIVLGVGEITFTYTPWVTGADFSSAPGSDAGYINADHRFQRIGGTGDFPPALGPYADLGQGVNDGLDALDVYRIQYLSTGRATVANYGGTVVEITGSSADSGATWTIRANRNDAGIFLDPYVADQYFTARSAYMGEIGATPPTDGALLEIEGSFGDAFEVVSMTGKLPLRHINTLSNSLRIRWSARPADSSTDATGTSAEFDERVWFDDGTTDLSFSLDLGGKLGAILYPEMLALDTPQWTDILAPSGSGLDWSLTHRFEVVIDFNNPAVETTLVISPPRHRWRIPGYLEPTTASPAPPLRLFPRDDGLGFSSSARIFPQPSSEQGSNRIGGYW